MTQITKQRKSSSTEAFGGANWFPLYRRFTVLTNCINLGRYFLQHSFTGTVDVEHSLPLTKFVVTVSYSRKFESNNLIRQYYAKKA